MKRMTKNNVKIFSIIKKMKKLYCVICRKYRKFEKPKISYLSEKTLVLSINFFKVSVYFIEKILILYLFTP